MWVSVGGHGTAAAALPAPTDSKQKNTRQRTDRAQRYGRPHVKLPGFADLGHQAQGEGQEDEHWGRETGAGA